MQPLKGSASCYQKMSLGDSVENTLHQDKRRKETVMRLLRVATKVKDGEDLSQAVAETFGINR